MLAVPAIDFQVHNSLFLVAHFHNMIIGGVVFGYFAGLTYWFPKIFGFKLNERLGKYAVGCWVGGFALAFIPLYILGFMGATRRLDHYDGSMGWQQLFIVAGVGVLVIGLGVLFQILQLAVSIRDRKKNRDTTGDPWNGRTLEWSTKSPTPHYNFAVIPEVVERDAFWAMKQNKSQAKKPAFKPFFMPSNTPAGMFIGLFAGLAGFAVIWHMAWLVAIGLIGVVGTIIVRSLDKNTEYEVTLQMVEHEEGARL